MDIETVNVEKSARLTMSNKLTSEITGYGKSKATIEFFIPTYKRPKSCVEAVKSILVEKAKGGYNNFEVTGVTVVEDCGGSEDLAFIERELVEFSDVVRISRNPKNKGMSLNIMEGLRSIKTDFTFILTDDDFLRNNALMILDRHWSFVKDSQVCYGYRSSFLEDGRHYTDACVLGAQSEKFLIKNAGDYLRFVSGLFILSGIVVNNRISDYSIWKQNHENSFFPHFFLGRNLSDAQKSVYYIHDYLVFHTVCNECHWDSWGKTQEDRERRLFLDYQKSISIIEKECLCGLSKNWSYYFIRSEMRVKNLLIHLFSCIRRNPSLYTKFNAVRFYVRCFFLDESIGSNIKKVAEFVVGFSVVIIKRVAVSVRH